MSLISRGILAAIFLVASISLNVVSLIPSIYWIDGTLTVPDGIITTYQSGSYQESLWRTCNANSSCTTYKLSWDTIKSNYKDAATDEHNGTIACVVISAFFAFVSLLVVFCNKKCGVIVLSLIAVIFSAAAVGVYAYYVETTVKDGFNQQLIGNSIKPHFGLYISAGAIATNVVALILACCMRKDDLYESLV